MKQTCKATQANWCRIICEHIKRISKLPWNVPILTLAMMTITESASSFFRASSNDSANLSKKVTLTVQLRKNISVIHSYEAFNVSHVIHIVMNICPKKLYTDLPSVIENFFYFFASLLSLL